ncbi:MAG: iron-containing alcohol dehydrogenase [Oscillospiraceae bacterium]
MMRPVKLAGDQLIWGEGSLSHLATLKGKKACIVLGGHSMQKAGFVDLAKNYLKEAGMETCVFEGVEPDPHFSTVKRGAEFMLQEQPDWIIAIGGGSTMDAAKTMWVFYEHPELEKIQDFMAPNKVPPLRKKAKFVCVPSTSGSASEVSRSIVITDDVTGAKIGVGDMEMMPDIAICDPLIASTMPKSITAQTGMDAMTHCIEALTSTRAHFLSDILASYAAKEIFEYLPKAFNDGKNLEYRERMLNASMTAGMAFTNVSLGIVHSLAQTLGGMYGLAHGLGDAIILPYIIEYNYSDPRSKAVYEKIAKEFGVDDLAQAIRDLNKKLEIPITVKEVLNTTDEEYIAKIPEIAAGAFRDGCTKTAPIIPSQESMEELAKLIYFG